MASAVIIAVSAFVRAFVTSIQIASDTLHPQFLLASFQASRTITTSDEGVLLQPASEQRLTLCKTSDREIPTDANVFFGSTRSTHSAKGKRGSLRSTSAPVSHMTEKRSASAEVSAITKDDNDDKPEHSHVDIILDQYALPLPFHQCVLCDF
eukprot:2334002-Rhodomonas_salina.1